MRVQLLPCLPITMGEEDKEYSLSVSIQPAKCWHCLRVVERYHDSICLFHTTNTFVVWGNKPWTKDKKFNGQYHPTKDDSQGHLVGFAIFHKYCYADWIFDEQQEPL